MSRQSPEPRQTSRWQDAQLLLVGIALIFAPSFTGEEAYLRGSLVSRSLALLLVFVSMWTLSGDDNFLPEMLNAALGSAFVVAAFCTHCAAAHRTTSLMAGCVIVALSFWAALRALGADSDASCGSAAGERMTDPAANPDITRCAPYRLKSGYGRRFDADPASQTPENVTTWSAGIWN